MLRRGAVIALLLAVACSSEAPLTAPLASKTQPDGGWEGIVKTMLSLEVTGAQRAVVNERETNLRIVEIKSNQVPPVAWFVSVSLSIGKGLDFRVPDGRQLLFTADLAPGFYRGPGTYIMTTRGSTAIEGKESIGSAAYIQFLQVEQQATAENSPRFDKLLEPCTLTVAEEFRTGAVSCPKLGNETTGDTVSLRWRWKRI